MNYLILLILLSITLYAKNPELMVKPKTQQSGIICCELNLLNLEKDIELKKLCIGNNKSIFEFEFQANLNACSILESNILEDEASRRYKPIYHTGLKTCPKLTNVRKGNKFYWGFELIDLKKKIYRIKEDEKMHPKMQALKWVEIDLSHCTW